MRNQLLFLAFLLPASLSAQLFLDFAALETGPCPYGPTVETTRPVNWDIYQTLDDQWDSPIDSTKCFSVEDVGNGARFEFDDVDGSRPLFFRAKFDPELLDANSLFNVTQFFDILFAPPTLNLGTDCPDGFCSGVMLGVEIPNEDGTGTAMRWHRIAARQDEFGLSSEGCVTTEKFTTNIVKEIIIQLTLDDTTLDGNFYLLGHVYVDPVFDILPIESINITSDHFNGIEYDFYLAEINGWSSIFHFTHTSPGYPSPQNVAYVEATLGPNSLQQQTFNIYVQEWETAIFQPFTALRGGLVAGDTLRHNLNFINDGGDICLTSIELVFEENTNFRYGGGEVGLHANNSCMMFRRGASLQILDGASLHYGHGGIGFLAVDSKSNISLGESSSLIIDNQFMLIDAGGQPEAAIDVELRPGQLLAFGKNARLLRNQWNENPMFLNVHMLGGTLDDSNLSEAERKLIRRIYPPASAVFADDVSISANPNNGHFNLLINLPEAQTALAEVSDLSGRPVFRQEGNLPPGMAQMTLETGLPAGVYFVKITSEGKVAVEKVVVR